MPDFVRIIYSILDSVKNMESEECPHHLSLVSMVQLFAPLKKINT